MFFYQFCHDCFLKAIGIFWWKIFVLNQFIVTSFFIYPVKTSKHLLFSNYFRGYRKRSVVWNGFISIISGERWQPLREKCPYSEFFGSVFSPDAKKYGPEKPRIRALSHTVMIPVTLIFSSILVTVMIFMLKCRRLGYALVGLPFLTL